MSTLVLDPSDVDIYLGAPSGVARRKFAVDFLTGNLYYTDAATGTWTIVPSSSIVGPSGSGVIDFGSIADGSIAEATFTLTGAVVGNNLAPNWPSTLNIGLVGMMFVSATDTVTVRLINLSGAPINPTSSTFGARVIL